MTTPSQRTPSPTTPDELRREFRAWLAEHNAALEQFQSAPDTIDAEIALLCDLQRLLFDHGWLRIGWPEAIGGLGGSPLLRGVVSEELAVSGCPPPFSFGMMEVLAPAVLRFAPEELSATYIPRLLRGDESWCQGFSEPEAGSDLGSLRLRAELSDDGYIVNGQKVWTSWAQFADRCVLLARTGSLGDGHRGITAFFVDMNSPGITVRPLRTINGAQEFAEIFFEDVVVPEERMVGEPGAGWAVTMQVLSCERGVLAWERQAWLHRRLEDLVDGLEAEATANARIGQVYADLYALRLMSRQTVRAASDGETGGPASSVDKLLMSAAEQNLFDAARELRPADFFLEEANSSSQWRDDWMYSRAASIYGGTAEIQRGIVAERLLGLPRAGK